MNNYNLDLITELLDKILPFLKKIIAPKWRQLFAWTIAAIVLTALNLYLGANYLVPEPPTFVSPVPEDDVVALGTTHFGALQLSELFYPSFADETITDSETLTPTYTVYALDSAGAVTMTLAACSIDGQLLVLIGDDANTITINDSNVRTNDGNAQTIGQYDVITWVCQDTEWVEISDSPNS